MLCFMFSDAQILSALPQPLLCIMEDGHIAYVNSAAEEFLGISATMLMQKYISMILPFASPITQLIEKCRDMQAQVSEYMLTMNLPLQAPRLVDIQLAPLNAGGVLLVILPRSAVAQIDRQLTYRHAARSVQAMAATLAHEIKNPLSGIRGAAQLLERETTSRDLTQLICDECDRLALLIDRFEHFTTPPVQSYGLVNVHSILKHVRQIALAGFGRHIRFIEDYDPSLPDVWGDAAQLTQVFLNLVKNAAEAIGVDDGEIILQSGFRTGTYLRKGGVRLHLPLEFIVIDNGAGFDENMQSALFEPFVSSKSHGTGLGLALVAKIIDEHGGMIECDCADGQTYFRVLLPMQAPGLRND